MFIDIHHSTKYTYSANVFPGTHYLFFHPMNRPYLRLVNYTINTDPPSSGLSGRVDRENNVFYQLWYLESIPHLHIEVQMTVELTPFNPYDFLLDPPLDIREPFKYRQTPAALLQPFLDVTDITPDMNAFISDAIHRTSGNVLDFFQDLNEKISLEWDHRVRLEENILSPKECFNRKSGSCRDLAWMLMNMLRSEGFASRFVSGYSFVPGLEEGHELHAWLEVLLPGAGWLAMDPTLGLLVTERHIPLAASFDPAHTLPVQGSYHGGASSEMDTSVVIQETTHP